MSQYKFFIIFFIASLALPTAALAFYKPSRVVIPELFGVECTSENICIDNISKLAEAIELRDEAVTFVSKNIGIIKTVPRFIFCSTSACENKFGMYSAAAYNVGTIGIVIRNKGWEKHYARHELIHHLQNERLGSITMQLFKPQWFREGMAYSLSEDPRRPIPIKELESFRSKFEQWNIGQDIWQRAKDL